MRKSEQAITTTPCGRSRMNGDVSKRKKKMKQYMAYVIAIILAITGSWAFCAERVIVRDITPTQTGVIKVKEYYGDNNLVAMREWLKPKDVLLGKNNSDALVVQSRERYLYNQDKKKVLEISELPDGTVLYFTITEYDSNGQIIAERSFDSKGHNHFSRLYKDGQVVKVIEEGRESKPANNAAPPDPEPPGGSVR